MKKIFFDLDNTLCKTENSDYKNSTPIYERIQYLNSLKEQGNHISIWTARGSTSGIDYKELTLKQLNDWHINYNELIMKKPNYDIYIDDKSFNVDTFLPIITNAKTKKLESEIVKKGWGKEIIFVNNESPDFYRCYTFKIITGNLLCKITS